MEIFDSELYLFYVFFWGGILVFLWDIGVHVKALRDHFCPKDPKDEEKKENAKKKLLPAPGSRHYSDGQLERQLSAAAFWACEVDPSNMERACRFDFYVNYMWPDAIHIGISNPVSGARLLRCIKI